MFSFYFWKLAKVAMLVNTSCVICLTVIFQLLFLYIKCLEKSPLSMLCLQYCFDLVWCVNCQRNKKLVSGVNTVLLGSVTYNVDLKCRIVIMFCTKTSCFLYLHSLLSCQLWRWRGRNFESSCETSILEAAPTKLRCANCSFQRRFQSTRGWSVYVHLDVQYYKSDFLLIWRSTLALGQQRTE